MDALELLEAELDSLEVELDKWRSIAEKAVQRCQEQKYELMESEMRIRLLEDALVKAHEQKPKKNINIYRQS